MPRPAAFSFDDEFDADELYHVAKTMRGRAAGLDRWKADELLLLPSMWWRAVANLWTRILQTGEVPALGNVAGFA